MTQSDSQSKSPRDDSWLKHVRSVSLLTFVSRIMGLIRDVGMAALFGNGPLLDSFTLAFRIPNLFRRLFGEGALTTAFLPLYIRAREEDNDSAIRLAWGVLLLLVAALIGVIAVGWLVVSVLFQTRALGIESGTLLLLTAMLLPYLLLICVSAQLCAILHAEGEFAIPATVPIVLNGVWIVVVASVPYWATAPTEQLQLITYGILFGGLLQLLFPAMALWKRGFRYGHPGKAGLKKASRVFREMLPIVLGISITQINALCDGALAWWYAQPDHGQVIAEGTASAIYFGQRMYQFPLGIFGAALGTVLFSRLAHSVRSGQHAEVAQEAREGIRMAVMIGIPASAGMILLATPIAETLFQRGNFDQFDAAQTARMIAAYGVAIWAFLGISVAQRILFAIGDAQSPVRLGMIAVVVNIALNFPALFWLGGVGLAYATSVTSILQFIGLVLLLRIRLPKDHTSISHLLFLVKILFATALMAFGVWLTDQLNLELLIWGETQSTLTHALVLLVQVVVAVVIFGGAMVAFSVEEWSRIIGWRFKRN